MYRNRLAITLLAVFAFVTALPADGTERRKPIYLKGPATVLDGGRLRIGDTMVRLNGLEALAKQQICRTAKNIWACGMAGLVTLGKMIADRPVYCLVTEHIATDEVRAICHIDGRDLSADMLIRGLALAEDRAHNLYREFETKAKLEHRGIWSSEFIHPQLWRQGKRLKGLSALKPKTKSDQDEFIEVDTAGFPWALVGRVDNGGSSFCTGALVGPDLVLTAAHCLVDKRNLQFFPTARIHFAAGLNGNAYIAHSTVRQYIPSPYFNPKDPTPQENAADDWAILKLAKPLGQSLGYFAGPLATNRS
jgi:endonuclease YncB( thermonuclease family)